MAIAIVTMLKHGAGDHHGSHRRGVQAIVHGEQNAEEARRHGGEQNRRLGRLRRDRQEEHDRDRQQRSNDIGLRGRGNDLPVQPERLRRKDQAGQEQRHAGGGVPDQRKAGIGERIEFQTAQRKQDAESGRQNDRLGQRAPHRRQDSRRRDFVAIALLLRAHFDDDQGQRTDEDRAGGQGDGHRDRAGRPEH